MSTILETLEALSKPLLLLKEGRKVRIDEWTFRIHYRTTTLLLFLFSALLSLREYLGDHIKCVQNDEDLDYPDVPKNVLESFCFISTTFTVSFLFSFYNTIICFHSYKSQLFHRPKVHVLKITSETRPSCHVHQT